MKFFYYLGLVLILLLAIAGIANGQQIISPIYGERHFKNQATGDTIVTSVFFDKTTRMPLDAEVQKAYPIPGEGDIIDQAPIRNFNSKLVKVNGKDYWRYIFNVRDKTITAFAAVRELEEAKDIMSFNWDWFKIEDADPLDNSRPLVFKSL